MPKKQREFITQIYDGHLYSVITPWVMHTQCCDCGLVHRLEIRTKGKEVIVKIYRDDKKTAARRRVKDCGLFRGENKLWKITRKKRKKNG